MLHKVLILTSKHTHTTWLRETPMTRYMSYMHESWWKARVFFFFFEGSYCILGSLSLSRCSSSLVLRSALAAPQKRSEVHGLRLKYASTAGRIAKKTYSDPRWIKRRTQTPSTHLRTPEAAWVGRWRSATRQSSLSGPLRSRKQTGTSCPASLWWSRTASGGPGRSGEGPAARCSCSLYTRGTPRPVRRHPGAGPEGRHRFCHSGRHRFNLHEGESYFGVWRPCELQYQRIFEVHEPPVVHREPSFLEALRVLEQGTDTPTVSLE